MLVANNWSYLDTDKIEKLMVKNAIPCIIALLGRAPYNTADQIFIASASYSGSFGNTVNTVFPLPVIALGIVVMTSGGCRAFVRISLGTGKKKMREEM